MLGKLLHSRCNPRINYVRDILYSLQPKIWFCLSVPSVHITRLRQMLVTSFPDNIAGGEHEQRHDAALMFTIPTVYLPILQSIPCFFCDGESSWHKERCCALLYDAQPQRMQHLFILYSSIMHQLYCLACLMNWAHERKKGMKDALSFLFIFRIQIDLIIAYYNICTCRWTHLLSRC